MANPIFSENILKDLVHYRTYAQTLGDGRRETRAETIARVSQMHADKFPKLQKDIEWAFSLVQAERVVPSMRSMQFAGNAIARSNARMYNCAYTPIETYEDFCDAFFLLMNGCGVGYSVQWHHVSQLPQPQDPGLSTQVYVVPDSKEGWVESLRQLLKNLRVVFDYSAIRTKGSPLSTGGQASGPESLQVMHERVRKILLDACGRKLTPIECHDIMCHIADIVVVGGVRRAALISLFDSQDKSMLTCKHGEWWKHNPQRARANNSAVVVRGTPSTRAELESVLDACFASGFGEPGISLTYDPVNYGYNPCHEIALRNRQLCNLTEVNVSACRSQDEFVEAVNAAVLIGTLQASYTDFRGIDPRWRKNCEEEALLGVSLTGLAENWDLVAGGDFLRKVAASMPVINRQWAQLAGVNPAARIGCVKPSGTTSAWLGTTSGIHAAHSSHYVRRVRMSLNDPVATPFLPHIGSENARVEHLNFVEHDAFNPENIIVSIPVEKSKAIVREKETALDLLERARFVYDNWIVPSHVSGPNMHNVSLTVSYKAEEMEPVKDWILDHANSLSGMSLLPWDGGGYVQAPFEEVSKDLWHAFARAMPGHVNTSAFTARPEQDVRMGELACSGGSCEFM